MHIVIYTKRELQNLAIADRKGKSHGHSSIELLVIENLHHLSLLAYEYLAFLLQDIANPEHRVSESIWFLDLSIAPIDSEYYVPNQIKC